MTINLKIILLVIAIALISALGGYYIGAYQTGNKNILPLNQNTPSKETTPGNQNDKLFTTQTAIVLGKITAVNGKKITVENIFKQTGELELSDQVTIFKFDPKAKTSSPSLDLKDIRLNSEVIVNLVSMDGKYYVTTIANRPPDPSFPPAPSSATPSSKLKQP